MIENKPLDLKLATIIRTSYKLKLTQNHLIKQIVLARNFLIENSLSEDDKELILKRQKAVMAVILKYNLRINLIRLHLKQ